jgi:hypothetical protein
MLLCTDCAALRSCFFEEQPGPSPRQRNDFGDDPLSEIQQREVPVDAHAVMISRGSR